MNIENGKFKVITPADGMWLCNRNAKTFSQKVYMALDADHSEWEEVTEEEKIALETKWNDAFDSEESEYAEAGRVLLGVME